MSELTTRLGVCAAAQTQSRFLSKTWQAAISAIPKKSTPDEVLQQLPDLIELLTSALGSGVSYREALSWVIGRASGRMRLELTHLAETLNVGDSVSNSLLEYEANQSNPALRELAIKLALADQLGSPVTEQLISLATALRAEYLVEFRKVGSKKETLLLLPLVFLVLPVTVLFAVYPSAMFLQFGSI